MDISELCGLLMPAARVAALSKCLKDKKIKRVKMDGLVGSAPAVVFSRLPRLAQPYLAVANDMDEAGYLYNDLCQILGDEATLIFRRAISATSNTVRPTLLRRFSAPRC